MALSKLHICQGQISSAHSRKGAKILNQHFADMCLNSCQDENTDNIHLKGAFFQKCQMDVGIAILLWPPEESNYYNSYASGPPHQYLGFTGDQALIFNYPIR